MELSATECQVVYDAKYHLEDIKGRLSMSQAVLREEHVKDF